MLTTGDQHAADDAEAVALELPLDEAGLFQALEDIMNASSYRDEGARESTTSFLGAWAVTDDSHDMSDSCGEEEQSISPPKKSHRDKTSADHIVSGDERREKQRRSVRKRNSASTAQAHPELSPLLKRHNSQSKPTAKYDAITSSMSESSLSDASGNRVRLIKKRKKKEANAVAALTSTSAAKAKLPVSATANNALDDVQRPNDGDTTSATVTSSSPAARTAATPTANAELSDEGVVGTQCFPERAEYRCTLCSKDYFLETSHNPWWALVRHECPRCLKQQYPTINISAPSNQISFLALPTTPPRCGETKVDTTGGVQEDPSPTASASTDDDEIESTATGEDDDLFQDRKQSTPQDSVDLIIEALAKSTTYDCKLPLPALHGGIEDGTDMLLHLDVEPQPPLACKELSAKEAKSMFGLFEHARYCSGRHRSKRHAHLCSCTKFVMLHLRDCAGTLPDGRQCPFSWCGPCRRALTLHLE